ncbi:unnamed protein product [Cylindrotheca closterium]|uniref:TOG domain-containing protein n=1 Tax=Cylindrotheca closterium TaxID=2856 RepID=A0AAD2CC34_9STRA|nr:unnamed protein product [Cylindrotheca closterium]
MASINANTKIKVASSGAPRKVAAKTTKIGIGRGAKGGPKKKAAAGKKKQIVLLKPSALATPAAIAELKGLDKNAQKQKVTDLCRQAMGESPSLVGSSKPRAASTTRDRGNAAADVAIAAKELGVKFVLKDCEVINQMQLMLFPEGIATIFGTSEESTSGLKASASALSLTSLDNTADTLESSIAGGSMGTDSKRGKTTPATAREGSLLLIRAFCEILGKKAEPYVVGAFLAAALDECGSSSGEIREAAEDASTSLVQLANPWAFPSLICPLLLQSFKSKEWRVKANGLDLLAQCATTARSQVCNLLPTIIPACTDQVWDTKAQVTKAAAATLLAVCYTCSNADVEPAIPAVVNAICKPSDTMKAVQELMGTTFVVPVDAPALSILCPVLARALKEKLAIHKRSACVVISNMSRLVGTPDDVAPFGPLLVPELKKVSENVQFEEIRDEALRALANLTKALGDRYQEESEQQVPEAVILAAENAKVEAEQKRIEEEREAARLKEEETKKKEEEERKKFKEAMDATRELEKLRIEEEKKQKAEEQMKKEEAKLSTKGGTGKCNACGLKKCKKTCVFFGS